MLQNPQAMARTASTTRTRSTHLKNLPRNTFHSNKTVQTSHRKRTCTQGTCLKPSRNNKPWHTKITLLNSKEAVVTCHLRLVSLNNTRIKHKLNLSPVDPSIRAGTELLFTLIPDTLICA